jgi:hypothetical protein
MTSLAKSTLPLTLVGTLLASAVGLGVTYGANKSEIDAQAAKIQWLVAKQEKTDAELAEQKVFRARVETQLGYQTEALKRLEQRLGTRP